MPLFSQPLCATMDMDSGHDTDISMALPSPLRPAPSSEQPQVAAISPSSPSKQPSVNDSVPVNSVTSWFMGLSHLIGNEYPKLGINFMEKANDDLEGEQETIPVLPSMASADSNEEEDGGEPQMKSNTSAEASTNDSANIMSTSAAGAAQVRIAGGKAKTETPAVIGKYKDVVKEYSKGATPRTHKFIKPNEDFFSSTPHEDTAYMIVTWIMDSCDAINLDGTIKPDAKYRQTFNHAQKMHAAATFGFGRVHGLRNTPWSQSEVTGKMVGNPSVSQQVLLYMLLIISQKTLCNLYNYNTHPDRWTIKPLEQVPHHEKMKQWGGVKFCQLMHLAYCITFLCLLQIDEVLNIQFHELEIVEVPVGKNGEKTKKMLKVTLPFRKTNQFGSIQPFYLKLMPDKLRYLCAYQAYAKWIKCCQETDGFVFQGVSKADCISKTNKLISPGEAEADLATFNAHGIINCILSDDVDTFLFGAQCVICMRKPDPQKDDVFIFSAVAIENDNQLGLDHDGFILAALVSGSDYHRGLKRAGISTEVALAHCRYGRTLVEIFSQYEGQELKVKLEQ
ncbi:hypothetical protein WG66_002690 [Moniliophthora roreri]|nr:hypothetical protein WG66_002690 [Moniliophthora roreri]